METMSTLRMSSCRAYPSDDSPNDLLISSLVSRTVAASSLSTTKRSRRNQESNTRPSAAIVANPSPLAPLGSIAIRISHTTILHVVHTRVLVEMATSGLPDNWVIFDGFIRDSRRTDGRFCP